MDRTATVVLGAHRSGTSAMTRALSLTGLRLPRTLMTAQVDNAQGFWESQAIADLNDEMLAARDTDWRELFPLDETPLLSNSAARFMGRAEALIQSEFEASPHIVLKDPRICLLTTFWRRALTQVGYGSNYVLMVRQPLEVARSLASRNGCSVDRGLLIWLANMLSAERSTRDQKRLLVLYEDLLHDPRAVLDDVEMMLGHPLPRRTPKTELEVERWLDARLRHYSSPDDFRVRSELYAMVQQAYAWFTGAAKGASPPPEELDRIAQRLKTYEQMFAGVLAELKGDAKSLLDQLEVSDARLKTAEAKANTLEGTLSALRGAEAAAQREARSLSAVLVVERAEADVRVADLEAAQRLLTEALAQTAKRDAEIASLRASLADTAARGDAAAAALQSDLTETSAHLLALQTAKAELDTRVAQQNEALASLLRRAGLALDGDPFSGVRALFTRFERLAAEAQTSSTELAEERRRLQAAAQQREQLARQLAEARAAIRSQLKLMEAQRCKAASAEAAQAERELAHAEALQQAEVDLALRYATQLQQARLQARSAASRAQALEADLRRQASDFEEERHKLGVQVSEVRADAEVGREAQRRHADDLRVQLAELTSAIAYLQRRRWWRVVSWLKTSFGRQPSCA